MAQKLDPRKFIKQIDALEKEAEKECIELLKAQGAGFELATDVDADEGNPDLWIFTQDTDNEMLQLHSYKLNDKGKLCFKAWEEESGDDYNGGRWTTFDKHVEGAFRHLYAVLADNVEMPTPPEPVKPAKPAKPAPVKEPTSTKKPAPSKEPAPAKKTTTKKASTDTSAASQTAKLRKAAEKVWNTVLTDRPMDITIRIKTGFLRHRKFRLRITRLLTNHEFGILYTYARGGKVDKELTDWFNNSGSEVLPFFVMPDLDLTLADLMKIAPYGGESSSTHGRFWYPSTMFNPAFDECNPLVGDCIKWMNTTVDELAKRDIPDKGRLSFPEKSTICFCQWKEV